MFDEASTPLDFKRWADEEIAANKGQSSGTENQGTAVSDQKTASK